NGGDLIRSLHGTYGNGAGALDLSVDVDRAGATLSDATAVFGSGQSELFAQHPEQRHIAADVHLEEFAIHVQLGHAAVASDLVADLYSHPHLRSILTSSLCSVCSHSRASQRARSDGSPQPLPAQAGLGA